MKKISYLFKRIISMDYKSMFKIIDKIHKRSNKNKILLFFDIIYCGLKYQAGYRDYYLFYFEELTNKQRSTYITRGICNEYYEYMNDRNYYHLFNDKIEFNKLFKKYLKRDYIDLIDSNYEEYLDFLNKHNNFMAKVIDLSGGEGIEKISIEKDTNLKELYERLIKGKKVLLEEYVIQHHILNDLCPTSVNTLRIVCIRKNNKTNIMATILRIGNGLNNVDNFHSGGMFTIISDEGIILKPAMDRDGNAYEYHPITKAKIIGLKVPFYKEALDMVIEASSIVPQIGFSGFDVAICENGPCIIEGNELPDYEFYQSKYHLNEDRIGLKPLFDKIIYS